MSLPHAVARWLYGVIGLVALVVGDGATRAAAVVLLGYLLARVLVSAVRDGGVHLAPRHPVRTPAVR
ncbi:hypothetical protein [Angustibacter aerolatus]|uniref:Uncharacterized protein n=1 Tax=Angustibacter aerolatus TaxID=1162965 RepID=A0ABQ6JKX4_9ACTN|nr:hypothetical protein GCM10025868_31550 [Angustibacter aerolatus]